MSSRALEAALRYVPGAGPVSIERLTAGFTNQSFKVLRDARRYSLRLAAGRARELGIERVWECKVLREAAGAGLAPPIERCEPAAGVLVARWIDGRIWSSDEPREASNVHAVADLLRGVHALPIPQPVRAMSPAAWIDHYTLALARCAARLAVPSAGLRRRADEHLRCLALCADVEPTQPVLCHSDLHPMNVAVLGPPQTLVLLDWEYAHVSDAYWDLAGWVANNDWAMHDDREWNPALALLSSYLRRPALSAELGRLQLFAWLYDFVCLLWSELYLTRGGKDSVTCGEVRARAHLLTARLTDSHANVGSRAG